MAPVLAPTLSDGVVTLRAHRADDAERCYEQCLDPLSRRWTTVPLDYTRAMATGFVTAAMPGGWATGTEWAFAMEVEGRYGGTVSLRPEEVGRAEIAYGSHPDIRGTGTVERALRLLLDWGFADASAGGPGLEAVEWRAIVGNWASRKVAHRLGFVLEGTLRSRLPQRGGLHDAWVATLVRDDLREPATPWLEVPTLEADGLLLRAWRASDVRRIAEACADTETQAWLGTMPTPYGDGDARRYLETITGQLAGGRAVTWAVVDPAAEDVALASVGWFGLTPGVEAELGYWAHPDARGRGVVSRASRRAVAHAFDTQGVARVRAFAAVDNVASQRVLEACGMTRTGTERLGTTIRSGPADAALYDVLAGEWAAGAGTSARR